MQHDILIYSFGAEIFVTLWEQEEEFRMELYNMRGECIRSGEYGAAPFHRLRMDVETGFYRIHLEFPGRSFDEKIYLESK
ncbi:MAG: hypothetical protein EOL88_08005 [Bacteroidia bacterium]|nr:hypothetical protein [Bacteroidia bacterium]